MPTLPSATLTLLDGSGTRFGVLRFATGDIGNAKGDCIFDIAPAAEQADRSEVRWLHKRRYLRSGDHRFRLDDDGVLTVSQGDFSVILDPDGERLRSRRPAPLVFGEWA